MTERRRPSLVDDESPTIDRPPAREVLGTVEQRCRVPLTTLELTARSAELADLVGSLDEMYRFHENLDEDARAAKKDRAAAEGTAERRCTDLSRDIRTKSETRPVECEEIVDWGKRIVEISRIDTGEIVSTRSITDADRQRTLPTKETP